MWKLCKRITKNEIHWLPPRKKSCIYIFIDRLYFESEVKVLVSELCSTPRDPMDCRPPDSCVRTQEWVAIPLCRGSSWPTDWTHIFCSSCIGWQILYHWATWEALIRPCLNTNGFSLVLRVPGTCLQISILAGTHLPSSMRKIWLERHTWDMRTTSCSPTSCDKLPSFSISCLSILPFHYSSSSLPVRKGKFTT